MKIVKATVTYNKEILPGGPHRTGQALASHIIHLHSPEVASEAKPGQFVMVRSGEDCILPRPFSIHQVIKGDVVLFFAVLEGGKGSQWLSQRTIGDTVELFGPLGNGFSVQPEGEHLLLIAGGMGLAPLCFLAQQAVEERHSVTLLLGSSISPLYSEHPENLLPPRINVATATEDGSSGHHGKITDIIPKYLDRAEQIYACGPLPMYRTMAQMPELKDKRVQISLEVRMGCGLGVCYGCTVKTTGGLKQVCRDGPVFDMNDILWDSLSPR